MAQRRDNEHPLRSKGFAPALSDSEVMTMEIVAEYQGMMPTVQFGSISGDIGGLGFQD